MIQTVRHTPERVTLMLALGARQSKLSYLNKKNKKGLPLLTKHRVKCYCIPIMFSFTVLQRSHGPSKQNTDRKLMKKPFARRLCTFVMFHQKLWLTVSEKAIKD